MPNLKVLARSRPEDKYSLVVGLMERYFEFKYHKEVKSLRFTEAVPMMLRQL